MRNNLKYKSNPRQSTQSEAAKKRETLRELTAILKNPRTHTHTHSHRYTDSHTGTHFRC